MWVNTFCFWKTLFWVDWSTKNLNLNYKLIFNFKNNIFDCKTKIFLIYFFKKFGLKNFNIFFYYFLRIRFLNYNKFIYTNKTFFFKYNLFFFYKNYKLVENLCISKYFWFNLSLILKKITFLTFFIHEFEKLLYNYKNKIMYLTNLNCDVYLNTSLNLIFLNYTFGKITYIFNNPTIFLLKLNKFDSYKTRLLQYISNIFFNKKYNFVNTYLAYQAFLSNHFYLIWNILFINTFSTTSFDFLLLWNFNKILFWIGDTQKITFLTEFLIWGEWNIIYWKGKPYYTFDLGKNKNNFIPNVAYYKFNNLPKLNFITNEKLIFNNFIFNNY